MIKSKLCVPIRHKLIISIVKKGLAKKVIEAAKSVGVEGATTFLGRGSAHRDVYLDILGMNFEPEKDIVFTYVQEEICDLVLEAISQELKLDKPNTGVAFVINIKAIAGICHLMNRE